MKNKQPTVVSEVPAAASAALASVGDTRWIVSWSMPKAGHPGDGECEGHEPWDCCDAHRREYRTRDEAVAFARGIGQSFWGYALVEEEVMERIPQAPGFADWELTGREIDVPAVAGEDS